MTDPKFQVEAAKYGPRTVAPPPPAPGSRLTELVKPDPSKWWTRAACRGLGGADTVWLVPERFPYAEVREALKLCESCPVKAPCGLEDQGWGIAGGIAHVSKGPRRKAQERPKTWAPKICPYCGTEFRKQRRYCSPQCQDTARNERRASRGTLVSVSAEPILSRFPDEDFHECAQACRVSLRTVYRWRAGATLAQSVAERVAHHLGLHPYELWPELRTYSRSNVVDITARIAGEPGAISPAPALTKTPRRP